MGLELLGHLGCRPSSSDPKKAAALWRIVGAAQLTVLPLPLHQPPRSSVVSPGRSPLSIWIPRPPSRGLSGRTRERLTSRVSRHTIPDHAQAGLRVTHMLRTKGSIVAMAMGISILAGCGGGSGSPSTGPTTITIVANFTSDIPRGQVLDKLITEFNAAHKGQYVVVNNQQADWNALQAKIRTEIAAGTAPDVFMYNFNPADLSREKSGVLMNFLPYLNADPAWKARFPQTVLKKLTINGQIFGIPGDEGPAVLYYHSDLFAKAGIASPPTTWTEFFADCDKLKAAGITPLSLMTTDDAWHTMNAFSYVAAEAGGPNVFAPGASLDTSAIVTAAQYTQRMFQYTTADAVGANYSVASEDFISGKTAMIFDGTYLNNAIEGLADPCEVKTAPAPTLPDSKMPTGFTVTDSLNEWGAKKETDPKKTAAVVAWLKFFTSNENAVEMAVSGQYLMTAKMTLSTQALSSDKSCQMSSIVNIANKAADSVTMISRALTPAGLAQIPALVQGLALGSLTPDQFASQLQQANTSG